ncbi:MAG: polysaccharide pyruvyl transferase family protein [Rikenellaceae bacterium]
MGSKVGVLTFQYARNYGAQMQCYALQRYLKSLGSDVQVINYIPSEKKRPLYRELLHLCRQTFVGVFGSRKSLALSKKSCRAQALKIKKFQAENMTLTSELSFEEIGKYDFDFDIIIVGSDQIWNPYQHKDALYFLSPFVSYKGVRASYAPCCAKNSYSEENRERLQDALNKFDLLSVRNIETQRFVASLVGRDVPIVCDPTFLIQYDDLNEVVDVELPEKYILTYVLASAPSEGHKIFIEEIKRRYPDCGVVSIVLDKIDRELSELSDVVLTELSPEQWVRLFKGASFVYTDSFHGMAFALNFKIQFLAYYVEALRASRFLDMASKLNLGGYIVDSFERYSCSVEPIDYADVCPIIESMVSESKEYINKILQVKR